MYEKYIYCIKINMRKLKHLNLSVYNELEFGVTCIYIARVFANKIINKIVTA